MVAFECRGFVEVLRLFGLLMLLFGWLLCFDDCVIIGC